MADRRPNHPAREPDPDMLRLWLQQQGAEIEVRREEVALQKQQLQHAHTYAEKALVAQVEDRKDDRADKKSARRERMGFGLAVIALFAAGIWYCLATGRDVFAMEALKAMVFLIAGGVGGYSIGRNKASQKEGADNE